MEYKVDDSSNNKLSDESDMDAKICQEEHTKTLLEENSSLHKQIAQLKAQFENALIIAEKVNEYQNQINQLYQVNRELTHKVEEGTQKLEILTSSLNEANKKLEDERLRYNNDIAMAQSKFNSDILKLKHQHQKHMDKVSREIDSFQAEVEKSSMDRKILNKQIERALGVFKTLFDKNFEDFDEFLEYVENNPELKVVNCVCGVPEDQYKKNNAEFQNIIDSLKMKLKSERAKKNEFKNQVTELETKNDNLERSLATTKNNMERDILDLKENYKRRDQERDIELLDYKHQIEVLQSRVDSLRDELLKKTKDQIKQVVIPTQVEFPQSNISPVKQEKSNKSSVFEDELSEINSQLMVQLSTAKKQKEEVLLKLRNIEKEMLDVSTCNQKLQNELDSTKCRLLEKSKEYENFKNIELQNIATHSEKKIDTYKREIKQYKQSSDKLIIENSEVKRSLDDLKLENERLRNQLQQMKLYESELSSKVSDLEDNLKRTKGELIRTQQVANSQPKVKVSDLFPSSIYLTKEFDTAICTSIADIARNESLQPMSKIQSIYHVIYQHYDKVIREFEKEAIHFKTLYEQRSVLFNKFIIDASVQIGGCPVNIDTLDDNKAEEILKDISKLKNTMDDQKKTLSMQTNALNYLCKVFNLDSRDPLESQIDSVKLEFSRIVSKLAKSYKKYKQTAFTLAQVKETSKNENDILRFKVDDLTNRVETLTKNNKNINDNNIQLKTTLFAANNKIRDLEDKYSELNRIFDSQKSDIQNAVDTAVQNLKHQYQNEISRLNNELNKAKEQLDEAAEKIIRLKKAYRTQKETYQQLADEMSTITLTNEQAISEQVHRNHEERRMIEQECNEKISLMQAELSSYKSQFDMLTKDIQKKDKKLYSYKETISNLQLENGRLERELNVKIEEMDRTSKLVESTSRNAGLIAEANYTQKLNELRINFDSEKRKLFSFVATEFRQYFDPRDSIDENSFKHVLTSVSKALNDLRKTDDQIRRLVNANEDQNTDDAVAQIILSRHP